MTDRPRSLGDTALADLCPAFYECRHAVIGWSGRWRRRRGV